MSVDVRPIQDTDLGRVARFLHCHLDERIPESAFRRSFAAHGISRPPNNGVMLLNGDQVVGAYLAYYSEREVRGRQERICNLGSWCVLPKHRFQSVRMAKALLAQDGLHFLDLSPSGTVPALNEKLGFEYFDDRAAIVPAVPVPHRPGQVSADPTVIDGALSGAELQHYRDHRGAAAAHHVVLRDRGEACYVVFRIERRRGLRVATLMHVGRPAVLRRLLRPLGAHVLLKHRCIALVVEMRWLDRVPAGARVVRTAPKMFRSPTLRASDLDYFYSELLHLQW